ncbi:hypothetical protein QYF36_010764 [Acer negundo]|nr:hypothetical protein QYF36_010764 [Acer negundo]
MGSVWFPQAQTEARRDSNPYSVANRLDKGSVCPSFCRLRHIGCPKLLNSSCSSSFSLSSPFLFGDFWIDFLLVVDLGDDSKVEESKLMKKMGLVVRFGFGFEDLGLVFMIRVWV